MMLRRISEVPHPKTASAPRAHDRRDDSSEHRKAHGDRESPDDGVPEPTVRHESGDLKPARDEREQCERERSRAKRPRHLDLDCPAA